MEKSKIVLGRIIFIPEFTGTEQVEFNELMSLYNSLGKTKKTEL
jgi:hypothetical protein